MVADTLDRGTVGGSVRSATLAGDDDRSRARAGADPDRRAAAPDLQRDPAFRDRSPRQRPRGDPQLRPTPVRVRGDLLHRRLPRPDEHPRSGSAAQRRPARWPPRCWPWASTPSAARCSSRATAPSTRSSRWLLCTVTPVSWLERTPTYKEKKQTQPDDLNHGLLTYPVLQAADIVIYKASVVPVGKDQAAHLELSREIVRAFNSRYGDTFPEPQAVFTEAPVVLGTDGVRKMSKSVGNTIDILGRPRRHPEAGHVDGHRHEADPAHRPRPPRGLQRLPAPPVLRRRLRGRSGRASGRPGPAASTRSGCWPTGSSPTTPSPRALHRAHGPPDRVDGILEAGADRLRPKAEATMAEVRERMGLR